MIAVLLSFIVVLLLPGGAPFLMRLCSGVLILMSLAIVYALYGTAAFWIIGGLAAVVAGAFVYALLMELMRPRKRLLSGGR